ncbi:MFS transporter [Calothrix sp. NIES-3974]|uniref:MFS transporter n=1 Tax=Calothrix sp. NIES-3974 TaxID=2005462 RepID=UPI001E2D8675
MKTASTVKVFQTLDKSLQRNLLILFTAGLFFWSCMAALLPTLPLYAESIGATKQQIGLVMGSFAIGLLLFRPQLGRMVDQGGRKKVLLLGISIAAIAPVGYTLIKSVPLLMLIRAVHGVSIAAFTTAYSTLVTDFAPAHKRGEIIGYLSLVNPVGMAIGPAVGGFLLFKTGYPLLFLFASLLAILSFICAYAITSPPVDDMRSPQQSKFDTLAILLSPRVRIPTLVMLMVGLAFGTISTFVPLFIKSLQIDFNPGLFYSFGAITSFSIRLIAGRVSDRIGRGLFITIGIICYCLSMFTLWQADDQLDFILAALIQGTGGGIMIPMLVAMMADRSYPQERGRIFAICVGGFDVGIATAGPTLGLIAESFGYENMFLITGIITLFAIGLFLTNSSKTPAQSLRFALGKGEDAYIIRNPN